ncbi:MAG TPA: amidohydrolase family protein [Burkholderiales bacterium]|nr:amidohydrolase family protein [Burkholderiales bacterium]
MSTALRTLHGVTHSEIDFDVPAGACDCHVHVFGPVSRFPYSPTRAYTPPDASVESLLKLQHALHMDRVVIVHPSPYGADNRVSIDAALQLGLSRARVVAVIDPATISDAELEQMHLEGVRGVRVNLESAGVHDPAAGARLLKAASERVAAFGWHTQVYTTLDVIHALAPVMKTLPTPVVIDHMARADAAKGVNQPGFAELLDLVRSGKAWVKLSAPHRIGATPDDANTTAIAHAFINANIERMVWGTDWPHPGGNRRADKEAIEPYSPIDDGKALNRFAGWLGHDAKKIKQVLVDNPAKLYDYPA